MIATDIFPILAFCFGFIITRCLPSRPRSNEMGDRSEEAAGIRLGSSSKDDGIDIERGSPNAQCNGLARRTPNRQKKDPAHYLTKRKTEHRGERFDWRLHWIDFRRNKEGRRDLTAMLH